jgi:hypothetical protein
MISGVSVHGQVAPFFWANNEAGHHRGRTWCSRAAHDLEARKQRTIIGDGQGQDLTFKNRPHLSQFYHLQ